MYPINNLSYYEFEELCCDVATRMLGIPVRMFGEGPDSGVDIKDYSSNKEIIIQVKKYSNSSTLINSLKKEVEKVKELNPKKYYVMTSLNLTPDRVNQIFNLFSEYMVDESHIITRIEINNILKDNIDIVRKNIKLWFHSENVLQLIQNKETYIDSEQLKDELNRLSKVYVKTEDFDKSLHLLRKSNVLIITGAPASGKTILSKMLVYEYISRGYKVIYSTANRISKIKDQISSGNDKEVILLDDVLGQTVLDIDSGSLTELMSFINYIETKENKVLILNSRVTILNQQTNENQKFKAFVSGKENKINHIEVDSLDKIQKAKILYSHIVASNFNQELINTILNYNLYLKIISHKNYNPRLIEYITNLSFINKIEVKDYFKTVIEYLNNPILIWEDEFKSLKKNEKYLILAIYVETVLNGNRSAFEKNIRDIYFDMIDEKLDDHINYDDIISKLSESIIIRTISNNYSYIGFYNASFIDYLNNYIRNNDDIQMMIIKKIRKIEGLKYLTTNRKVQKYLTDLILKNNTKVFESASYNEFTRVTYIVTGFNLFNEKIEIKIHEGFTKFIETNSNDKNYVNKIILSNLLNYDYVDFYNLRVYLETHENIKKLYKILEDNYVSPLINTVYKLLKEDGLYKPEKGVYELIVNLAEKNIEDRLYGKLSEFCLEDTGMSEEELDEKMYDTFLDLKEEFNEYIVLNIEYNLHYDFEEEIQNAIRYKDAMYDKYYDYEDAHNMKVEKENEERTNEYISEIFSDLKEN
ncbi:MAG: restriction endonuclease [Acholeplasmataceae bacterium]|nr:restriction endonuclease [Acholeplasmataceae bacterium]